MKLSKGKFQLAQTPSLAPAIAQLKMGKDVVTHNAKLDPDSAQSQMRKKHAKSFLRAIKILKKV